MPILAQITSDDVLDTAYEWLCRRRRDYSANSDVWGFRRRWQRDKAQIRDELRSGSYRFSLLSRITLKDDDDTDLWSARDALVLKALAIVLAKHLPVSQRCTYLKGHGGAKFAVREVRDHLAANRFVLRTDVKSYYASINHVLLIDQLAAYIRDRPIPQLRGSRIARRITRNAGADVCATTLRSIPKCSIEVAADTRRAFNSTNRESIVRQQRRRRFYPCIFFSRI